jgi:putative FmdB family regulatory protein
MPLYEFRCKHCNTEIEMLKKMDEKRPKCSVCGRSMVRLMSSTTFILNGRNWAKDNYGLKKGGKNEKRMGS